MLLLLKSETVLMISSIIKKRITKVSLWKYRIYHLDNNKEIQDFYHFLDELAKIKAFYEQEVQEGMKLLNNASNDTFKLRQDLENAIEKKNEAERKYEEKNISVRRFS